MRSTLKFSIKVDQNLYEYRSSLTIPPRAGELALLTGADDGWSEEVKRVWFDVVEGCISVELCDVADVRDEGLAQSLIDAGWRPFGNG